MFRNKSKLTFKKIFFLQKPKKYFLYILIHFAKTFFIFSFIFFIVLFAINQSSSYDGYDFYKNLFFSLVNTISSMDKNINIVCLVSCIFFFIRESKSFNVYILESFGITTKQFLKPIIVFLTVFCLFKIFFIHALYVKLENFSNSITDKTKQEKNIKLKTGTSFAIISENNQNDYIIIFGDYIDHNDTVLNFENAIFLKYNNKKLKRCYTASKASLSSDKYFFLKDVNITDVVNGKNIQDISKNIKIKSIMSVKDIVVQIYNGSKIEKTILLNVYDHLKLLQKQRYSYIVNDAENVAITYIISEIIYSINIILCCFLSFFFCVNGNRNTGTLKNIFKCFISYFVVLRLFHFIENTIIISRYISICVIGIAVLLCVFMQYLILNRDWCDLYRKEIIKDADNFLKKYYLIIRSFFEKKLFH